MSRNVSMLSRHSLGQGVQTEDKYATPIPYRQTPQPMNGVQPTTPAGASQPTGSQVGKTIPFPR